MTQVHFTLNTEEVQSIIEHSVKDDVSKNILTTIFNQLLEARHMEGMEGATATIDDAVTSTVYMVDYQPTDGGEVVRNHKWLTEEELGQE